MSLLSSEAVPAQKLVTLQNISYTVRGQRTKHACAASGSRVCLSQSTVTATDLAKFTYAMKPWSPVRPQGSTQLPEPVPQCAGRTVCPHYTGMGPRSSRNATSPRS